MEELWGISGIIRGARESCKNWGSWVNFEKELRGILENFETSGMLRKVEGTSGNSLKI